MNFGARLAHRRKALGMTQVELAYRLSSDERRTDSVMISRWENGVVPHLDVVPRLADVLGVSVQWLMTGEPVTDADHKAACAMSLKPTGTA